jgi:hypothetical protein
MKPYENSFAVGQKVRVADRDELQRFMRDWKWHHPLSQDQLTCAGRSAKVEKFGFYHGGDVLYWLKSMPGIWHEECLRMAGDKAPKSD